MSRKIFYIVIIIALLLANLLLAGNMIWGKKALPPPPHPRGAMSGGPQKLVIEKLNFDQKQIQQYEQLILEHQQQIRVYDDQIRALKNNLFILLQSEHSDTKVDSFTRNIADVQQAIESAHYNHFRDIESLCRPDQIKNFHDLAEELSTLFSTNRPPRP